MKTYPTLGEMLAIFDDFDTTDDVQNARTLLLEIPLADRIKVVTDALTEAHRVMADIEREWEHVGGIANRQIHNKEEAATGSCASEELSRLQNGGSKPA